VTPLARGWSGALHLAWVRGADFTRVAAVRIMGEMETGLHQHEPSLRTADVTGFVLDPDAKAKYMSVDGEAVKDPILVHMSVDGEAVKDPISTHVRRRRSGKGSH